HCIGCYESFNNSVIVYGQGDFLLDYPENNLVKTSMLINISIDEKMIVNFIPITKKGNCVRMAKDTEKENILNSFYERSEEILEEGLIEQKYEEFALININYYLSKFSGILKLFSYLERKLFNGWILNKKYNKRKLSDIRNYIECEAHRELIIAGIKIKEKS
ncbi:MAG: putative poly-gamma-glutamate synthesis protein, partial [Bacillota bacterium]|nr:putative poly-gamma-glutamate synthesis protein [Bacillota bacterium]